MKKDSKFTFRLSREQHHMLKKMARDKEVCQSEFMRRSVDYYARAGQLIQSQPVGRPLNNSSRKPPFWARFNFRRSKLESDSLEEGF